MRVEMTRPQRTGVGGNDSGRFSSHRWDTPWLYASDPWLASSLGMASEAHLLEHLL